MADDIRRVQVRIGGVTYSLVSAADEQYTRKIGARADEMIARVMQSNPQLSQSMATVLALVNAVDDMTRIYEKMQRRDHQQEEAVGRQKQLQQENKQVREENWELKKDILELRELCRDYEKQLATWRSQVPPAPKEKEGSQSEDALKNDDEPSPEAVEAAADNALTQTDLDDYLQSQKNAKEPPDAK